LLRITEAINSGEYIKYFVVPHIEFEIRCCKIGVGENSYVHFVCGTIPDNPVLTISSI
jgi:hypothetical protein